MVSSKEIYRVFRPLKIANRAAVLLAINTGPQSGSAATRHAGLRDSLWSGTRQTDLRPV